MYSHLFIILTTMKTKYFNETGEIAFRIWMFANALETLTETPNIEKAGKLYGKITAFQASPIMLNEGSPEQRDDLKVIAEKLTELL